VLLGSVGDELLARQVGAPGQEDADLDHRNSFEVTVPRRAEAALVTVVATSYLLGVSTRRMEKLVETLDITPAIEVAGQQPGAFDGAPGG